MIWVLSGKFTSLFTKLTMYLFSLAFSIVCNPKEKHFQLNKFWIMLFTVNIAC